MAVVDLAARRKAQDEGFAVSTFGVRMPRLIYGTAWKKERTADLVALALAAGFRGIDTACQPKHYHEPGVGAGLAMAYGKGLRRTDVYLQTKFTPFGGQDPDNLPYDPAAPIGDQVCHSLEVSLANLGTDYLDGLVLHSPYREDRDTFEAWRAMEALFDAGRVRQLGISNCYEPARLERIHAEARIKPAVIQNRFYAKTSHDRDIRAFCGASGILYESFWTLTANKEVLAAPALVAIAARRGKSVAQIFFRFLTQQDVVCLTGTTSPEHMREDLAIFDFRLTPLECAEVESALRASAG